MALVLVACIAAGACSTAVPCPSRAHLDSTDLGIPYGRYSVPDSLGRQITFYLSRPPSERADGKLPVALFIQGSGSQSLFRRYEGMVVGGYQDLLLDVGGGRIRVLAVEKPGVQFLDFPARPGEAREGSQEFLTEHTLERWAEANVAALRAAWALAGIDRERTLVLGHSEGGLVAARVAAELPDVTHVASLSRGGPTQLFDLVLSRSRPRSGDSPGDAGRRVQALYREWDQIRADPDSVGRFWLGHPYRRWSSFLRASLTEELLRTRASIYVAHGTHDGSTPVTSHDALVAELRARGRDVVAERIEGADHTFAQSGERPGSAEGMRALLQRILAWFLAEG
jgi:dipeptidyl aminopeptidase/acylaminoacyl peptidase